MLLSSCYGTVSERRSSSSISSTRLGLISLRKALHVISCGTQPSEVHAAIRRVPHGCSGECHMVLRVWA